MNKIMKKTTELLIEYGIRSSDIKEILAGNVDWDIVDDELLLLFNIEGGQHIVGRLTNEQIRNLLNAYRFESRKKNKSNNSDLFIEGTLDDWAGVSNNTNWRDYVDGYIDAAGVLGKNLNNAHFEPYLFICRHTIELMLKSIIMLYQELHCLMKDLPDHHVLTKLWTTAYPIIKIDKSSSDANMRMISDFIKEYDSIDNGSFSFRYPVQRSNIQIRHKEYLKVFSIKHHVLMFNEVVKVLNEILRNIELDLMLKSFNQRLK